MKLMCCRSEADVRNFELPLPVTALTIVLPPSVVHYFEVTSDQAVSKQPKVCVIKHEPTNTKVVTFQLHEIY